MDALEVKVQENIAYLTFNEPRKSNALSSNLLRELNSFLERAEGDREIDIIVFRGANKKFGAGADLEELLEGTRSKERAHSYSNLMKNFFRKLLTTKKLTITLVEGFAVGGQMEMLVFTDINIANKDSFFSVGGPKIGVFPAEFSVLYLPFLGRRALRYAILSERISASEAKELGIIDYVVEDVDKALEEVIGKLKEVDFLAIKKMKELRGKALELFLPYLDEASQAYASILQTGNARQRILAFFQSRTKEVRSSKP